MNQVWTSRRKVLCPAADWGPRAERSDAEPGPVSQRPDGYAGPSAGQGPKGPVVGEAWTGGWALRWELKAENGGQPARTGMGRRRTRRNEMPDQAGSFLRLRASSVPDNTLCKMCTKTARQWRPLDLDQNVLILLTERPAVPTRRLRMSSMVSQNFP